MLKNKLLTVSIVLLVLASGCASKPPAAISKIPADNPSLANVRLNIDQYLGAEIRWGGEISRVENRADQTWIEIVRRDLWEDGKPRSNGKSDGRFIASFTGFADPVVYEVGRPLTVVGTIGSKIKRPIGEYDYVFPVVNVDGSFLWQKTEVTPYPAYPNPWWYYDARYHRGAPYYRYPRY